MNQICPGCQKEMEDRITSWKCYDCLIAKSGYKGLGKPWAIHEKGNWKISRLFATEEEIKRYLKLRAFE